MNPIVSWTKKNWIIVACSAVTLISIPTAWFFANGMNQKLRTAREAEVNDKQKTIAAASKVNYVVHVPGLAKGWEYTGSPNVLVTEQFKKFKERIDSATGDILKTAEDFNKGVGPLAAAVARKEHKPLVEGIFPGPKSPEELEPKRREMEDVLIAKANRPNPYQLLLDSIAAGAPPDPVVIKTRLEQTRQQAIARKKTGNRELTPDEMKSVEEEMTRSRLGLYQTRAGEISVYATLKCLPSEGSGGRAIATDPYFRANAERLSNLREAHRELWLFQWDYWLLSDVLGIVRVANTDRAGHPVQVPEAVVKRIESITIDYPKLLAPKDDVSMGGSTAATGSAFLDPTVSVTGRTSSTTNAEYDVRDVTMSVIVSSARVQDLINAVSKTNFMTVIDLDLQQVDSFGELAQGYYYGEEAVVRATVKIETVWLRNWMTPLMPRVVRDALAIVLPGDEPAAPGDAAAAAAAPAGSPPPPRAAPAPPSPARGAVRGKAPGGG